MTEDERAALVDELDAVMRFGSGTTKPFIEKNIMPIIDRLLAERDLDALLDSVGCSYHRIEGLPGTRFGAMVIARGKNYVGTGQTRMAALMDAVAKAKGAGE